MHEREFVDYAPRVIEAAFYLEAQEPAKAAHLSRGEIVLIVRCESGIVDACNARMLFEKTREPKRVFVVTRNAHFERSQPAQKKPRVERSERRAENMMRLPNASDQRFRRDGDA